MHAIRAYGVCYRLVAFCAYHLFHLTLVAINGGEVKTAQRLVRRPACSPPFRGYLGSRRAIARADDVVDHAEQRARKVHTRMLPLRLHGGVVHDGRI